MEAEVWSVPHARPYPTTPPRQKLAAVFPRVHEENCVYVAAMRLDRRDRDQRRCQLLSRQPIPPGSSSLSPRNPTPSQATGTEQENEY
ncbi:hypothetical protein NQZ68_014071 [Dissostichus eleginoides]|nr:hypothetical protein NQZ68_014071 [Dissostichus eleginoides]